MLFKWSAKKAFFIAICVMVAGKVYGAQGSDGDGISPVVAKLSIRERYNLSPQVEQSLNSAVRYTQVAHAMTSECALCCAQRVWKNWADKTGKEKVHLACAVGIVCVLGEAFYAGFFSNVCCVASVICCCAATEEKTREAIINGFYSPKVEVMGWIGQSKGS